MSPIFHLAGSVQGTSGFRRSDSLGMKCCYCDKPDPTWSATDLQRGRRTLPNGTVEYHCYAGYAWD